MRFRSKPFKSKKEFRGFYEKEAEKYDIIRSADFEGRYLDETEFNIVYRHLKNKKNPKILDCGCGTGRVITPLARKGYDCYGIDASKNMLEALKKNAGKLASKIHLKIGDIENLPYKSNSFDFVYSFKVLMHLKDWKKAFHEIYRVTKKRGLLIFDIPNSYCPWRLLSPHKGSRAYSYKDLNKFMKKYNPDIISLYSYPSFFFRIPLFKYLVPYLERFLPFPRKFRRKFIFIIKKV